MNIVFDLDGTLIGARAWLCQLCQHLAPESPLSFSEYWAFKRRGLSNADIPAHEQGVVSRQLPQLQPGDWMVGDTGRDILAGRAPGLRTCAVLSGLLDRDTLLLYRHDLLLGSAVQFAAELTCSPARTPSRHNDAVKRSNVAV